MVVQKSVVKVPNRKFIKINGKNVCWGCRVTIQKHLLATPFAVPRFKMLFFFLLLLLLLQTG